MEKYTSQLKGKCWSKIQVHVVNTEEGKFTLKLMEGSKPQISNSPSTSWTWLFGTNLFTTQALKFRISRHYCCLQVYYVRSQLVIIFLSIPMPKLTAHKKFILYATKSSLNTGLFAESIIIRTLFVLTNYKQTPPNEFASYLTIMFINILIQLCIQGDPFLITLNYVFRVITNFGG